MLLNTCHVAWYIVVTH